MEKSQMTVKNIPPELLKEAKIKAVKEGRTLSEVVRELLASWAKKNPQPMK
jgi:plasmid stability protein